MPTSPEPATPLVAGDVALLPVALARPPGPPVPADLGAAAERFARTFVRKSPQTQRTYLSVYRRFAAWLADYSGEASPRPETLSADAVAAYLTERERTQASATVKKERAAINRLAKYLHALRLIDATEILMLESAPRGEQRLRREALDEATWAAVKTIARARLRRDPRSRVSPVAATRDLAIVLLLGDHGLRSNELRSLTVDSIVPAAQRPDAARPWLKVIGKGGKPRSFPLGTETIAALTDWKAARPPELARDELLFPRLGRQRRDGSFPDAGGKLSDKALAEIVAPIMRKAGVPAELCHPHVLRHTFGSLYIRRQPHRLSILRDLMGHASIETTSVYLHHTDEDLEAAIAAYELGADVLDRYAAHRAAR